MSEILKKYKEKTEYLEKLAKSHQALVSSLLSHYEILVKGDASLEKDIASLNARVKGAKNIFQVEKIGKDFLPISKKISAYVKAGLKGNGGHGFFDSLGSIFGGKDKPETGPLPPEGRKPGGNIALVDSSKEFIVPYLALLDELSKGTLLLGDDRDPFYAPLQSLRSNRFEGLQQETADALRPPLYNFFVGKSNEAGVVEVERGELKRIIGSLAGYIQSLSVTSDKFGAKLDVYARQVQSAESLSEVQKIKSAILTETLKIRKENQTVGERLSEANQKVAESGEKIAKLEKELEMAREAKSVDALTQVYNRGYFDERLNEALIQFERTKEPCCLIMYDIDHFKKFNDEYGHQAGDQVLKVVTALTKEKVRAADTVARYGGEEFAVILYKAKLADGYKVAEEIRNNIETYELGILGKTIHVTISAGVTEFKSGDTPEELIGRADKGLYKGKKGGRNRVVKV
ncbi:hypothetical protein MNBD_NITROSPINAE02-363 [hydrothermal vent metagenome]|uniref:GGDEF domain-containing protein n=1 Tax=hydrothermal vent metagenome TaxID=652676 RepID=A0A3B1C6B9_9ZZZZ